MMNLKEMRSMVMQLVGDPQGDKVNPAAVINYINMGQSVVAGLLVNVERERYQKTATISGIATGTQEYDLPTDLRELIGATVNLGGSTGPLVHYQKFPAHDVAALTYSTHHRPQRGAQHFFMELGGQVSTTVTYRPGRSRIRLYPSPLTGDVVTVRYYQRPAEFQSVDIWDGTRGGSSTGAGGSFYDPTIYFAGSATKTGIDQYWLGAQVRWKSGVLMGQAARVDSFLEDPGTSYGLIQLAGTGFAIEPGAGDTYEIAKVSIVPEQFHPLICYYAAALAAPRANLDPTHFMDTFEMEMEAIRAKWLNNIQANVQGQIPGGSRRSLVEGA